VANTRCALDFGCRPALRTPRYFCSAEKEQSGDRRRGLVRLVLFGSDVELAAGFRNAWATSTLGAIDGDAVQIPQIQQS